MKKSPKKPQTPFSKYLHQQLKQANKNIFRVAKESGIHHTSVHRWFYGEQLPPVRVIPAIARALQITPTELLIVLLRQEWGDSPANEIYESEAILQLFNLQSSHELSEEDLEALLRVQKDLSRPMTLAFMLEFLRLRKS